MALTMKQDGVKQVPWFSLAEWHEVYKQIYSNETAKQTKAYEALLAWKARMPKLPVGVDCTLSILQVCLRDREWTSNIDSGELPMYFENYLCLMYSTTIMRFLNHISNIGHTKQTSLFQIAKQLKIPEWIVNLRHDTAHGYELPSIGVLRIAINILLQWLHDEYWAAEIHDMEECYIKEIDLLEEVSEERQAFTDLIELWTAVKLYIHAGHKLVSDVPDVQLQETLQELRAYMLDQRSNRTSNSDEDENIQNNGHNIKNSEEYNLTTVQALLLSEISIYLSKNESILKKDNIVCNVLCENETFLPNADIMQIFMQDKKSNIDIKEEILPLSMRKFWKDIIVLLQDKGMIEMLTLKLFNIVTDERENKERRLIAAIWLSSISYSFVQLDIAQTISQTMEYELKKKKKKLSAKVLNQHIKERIYCTHPYLRNVLWFDMSSTVPNFFVDIQFLSKLLLNVNEFSIKVIKPIYELVIPRVDTKTKKHLSNLLKIYMLQKYNDNDNDNDNNIEKIFTVEDLRKNLIENKMQIHDKKYLSKKKTTYTLADQGTRNLHWKLALDTYQWVECPIGVLPWQVDSLKSLEPLESNSLKHLVSVPDSRIVAGVINSKNLGMESRINWDNILRKKRKLKKKHDKGVIMNRALENAKKEIIK